VTPVPLILEVEWMNPLKLPGRIKFLGSPLWHTDSVENHAARAKILRLRNMIRAGEQAMLSMSLPARIENAVAASGCALSRVISHDLYGGLHSPRTANGFYIS